VSSETIATANLRAARTLIDSFAAAGVRAAVLSPGARSGPLAVALDEQPAIRTYVVTDERSAAFFALGIAREAELPPLLVCTSGTAAANYTPAIAEASLAEVPLLVITADRPPEARGFGAAQTIRQSGLFERHARASREAAVPCADGPPARYYRSLAASVYANALAEPRGPVHVNIPFREPLLPIPLPPRDDGASDNTERLQLSIGEIRLASERIEELTARLCSVERGLIVCGPSSRPRSAHAAVGELARRTGWLVLADPLSGLRGCEAIENLLVEPHEVLLRNEEFRERQRPDLVLRFGSLPTSKGLQRALDAWQCEHVLFTSPGEWPDPQWLATEVLVCDPLMAAADVAAALARCGVRESSADGEWRKSWRDAAKRAQASLAQGLGAAPPTCEARAARDLLRALPEGSVLVVGNSMPVRDVDVFCSSFRPDLTLLGNRGANGIDGLLSTALGAAASSGAPTAVLLGDLSFLHDVGALQLAARHSVPLLIVVIDNDGGGIFQSLPCAELGETFERCFVTPHGLDLLHAAKLGRFDTACVAGDGDLARAVADWAAKPRALIVNVACDRRESTAVRDRLIAGAASSVEGSGG
jgi:2-succinyl-5-enolpyruvyl-6-hydroxy-3-cyclohexene-1-carboxylate synthase